MQTQYLLGAAMLFFINISSTTDNSKIRRVNKQFGTISTLISQIGLNPKNFVAVRRLNYKALKSANSAASRREADSRNKITNIDINMYDFPYGIWTNRTRLYQTKQLAAIKDHGEMYRANYERLTNQIDQLQQESPLAIDWSPEAINATIGTRGKRFVAGPLMAAIMGAAKLAAPSICSSVLTTAAEAVGKHGIPKVAEKLASTRHNYIQVPSVKKSEITAQDGAVQFENLPFASIDNYHAKSYDLDRQLNTMIKYMDIIARSTMEIENLNMHRQKIMIENDKFLADILEVKNGRVPVSLLPPADLKAIIQEITTVIHKKNLPLKHIADISNALSFYKFLTPILIIDSDNYDLLLFIIVPLIPSGNQLDLYHVTSLPFLTIQNIPMQVKLDQEYYVTDLMGSTHTLLTRAEYDACSRDQEFALCRVSRPLISEKSLCYSSLHTMGSTTDTIFKHCKFEKANGNQYHFLSISANTFFYFLPAPSTLIISCPEKHYHNATTLSRSGIFSFPEDCMATLDQHVFFDTSIVMLNQSVTSSKQVMNFLDLAKASWPLSTSFPDEFTLLQAAKDNNSTEQLPSIGTRAKIYHAIADILNLSHEQEDVKNLYNFLWYSCASIIAAIITGTIYSCWLRCFYKCQKKNHPPIPRPVMPAFRFKTTATSRPEDEKSLTSTTTRRWTLRKVRSAPTANTNIELTRMQESQEQNTYVSNGESLYASHQALLAHGQAIDSFNQNQTYHKIHIEPL